MTKKRKGRKIKKQNLVKAIVLVVILSLAISAYNLLPGFLNPVKYGEHIIQAAEENQVDPLLVCAIIKAESNFDPQAVSHAGAVGLMQIMPTTAEWLCSKQGLDYDADKLTSPQYNIDMGCYYLSFLMDYWQSDLPKVIASYNGGQANVVNWLKKGIWDGKAETYADIPFAETSKYVNTVLANYEQYTKLYGDDIRFKK